MTKLISVWLVLFAILVTGRDAAAADKLDFPLRGKLLTLALYRPQGPPKGTVVMGSGDVRWGGLGATKAEDLCADGYTVIGVNARQYLQAFTDSKKHLEAQDVPQDFRLLYDFLVREHLVVRPVIVSGVSEGAALVVLAASDPKNHDWIDGVILSLIHI